MTNRRLVNSPLRQQIEEYSPQIQQKDINRGVIWRYFVSRGNQKNFVAHEVSPENYERYKSNPTLVNVGVRWIIKGRLDDVETLVYTDADGEESTVVVSPGVRSQNRASIMSAADVIPVLNSILSPVQYYIGP